MDVGLILYIHIYVRVAALYATIVEAGMIIFIYIHYSRLVTAGPSY